MVLYTVVYAALDECFMKRFCPLQSYAKMGLFIR